MLGSANWRWMRQWKKNEKLAHKQGDQPFCTALHTLGSYSASLRWRNCEDTGDGCRAQSPAVWFCYARHRKWHSGTPASSLQAQGVTCQLLNATQAQALEPGLGQEIAWLNALHFPPQRVHQPAPVGALPAHASPGNGCDFPHRHIGAENQQSAYWPRNLWAAPPLDAIVLCTGAKHQLTESLGLRLPLMPTWGYSVTAPVRDALQAPRAAIMDWAQQATISRMGQRIRITAGLELGSPRRRRTSQPHAADVCTISQRLVPGGAHYPPPGCRCGVEIAATCPMVFQQFGASGRPGCVAQPRARRPRHQLGGRLRPGPGQTWSPAAKHPPSTCKPSHPNGF